MNTNRNQPAIEKCPFGFSFGVPLGLLQTQTVIATLKNVLERRALVLLLYFTLRGLNPCLCPPLKAEFNAKNVTMSGFLLVLNPILDVVKKLFHMKQCGMNRFTPRFFMT